MSHFSVAVFSRTPDEVEQLLAPFREDTDDPEYLELQTSSEDIEDLRATYDEERKGEESFENFLSRYYGYIYNQELDEAGYLCNPNAKWDWWEIGGRWRDMLKLKHPHPCHEEGTEGKDTQRTYVWCDQAQLKDIEFVVDQDAYDRAARFWEVYVEGQPLGEGESEGDYTPFYRPEYYLEQYGAKEAYANAMSSFSTWAFVTPDGEWHETGEMGWFGFSNATRTSRETYAGEMHEALKSIDPECYITIVDCHI